MRNEITTEKLGRPVYNRVLVQVIDTFNEFKTKAGVAVVNAAHDEAWADSEQASITEFIPRHGIVHSLPKRITKGSFDYDTELEIEPGDIVYWNSISFKESIPLVYGKKKFLLVDYHELLLRIRYDKITPINGFALLRAVEKEEKVLSYTVQRNVTERWEIAYMPEKVNVELNKWNEFDNVWEVGDIVYLAVIDKPFKIEGFMNRYMDEVLYAIPLRMILYSDENILHSGVKPD